MRSLAFSDRAVYLPDADALVVADIHLGRADASEVDFPLGERADLTERLATLCDSFSPAEVVFAGDVLHRFDRVSARDVEALDSMLETCRNANATPILVAGNHDTMLDSMCDEPVYDEYRLADETLVAHGHEEPDERAPFYVVGHDHPTLDIEGRTRPCALYGPDAYRGGDVLMLPAFTRLAAGVTVNGMSAADFQSPLVSNSGVFRPFIRDDEADETLTFPPLKKLRRYL
ncbi:metallophosphoesterase [Haloferax namakaokahaiae]|uniref:Metallophosphoesterase n=1 Tax=Haloferax namakaokahaiae TaxID=1748331 RepID=A0ABD5ZGC4_9EURY